MRYEGKLYRPPSEADAYILQATIGCSWNHCTYCDMYRDKSFRVRELTESLLDIQLAAERFGPSVRKVFVADGDALAMPMGHWEAILEACDAAFPDKKRVSCYATAMNLLNKTDAELARLKELGLEQLYIGPETGDDQVFKRIAKGAGFAEHEEAAQKAHKAGLRLSAIFLLGAGGVARSEEHARASARLVTAMDPEFLSALTLTIAAGTPIDKLAAKGKFAVPAPLDCLRELRVLVSECEPTRAVFRTNHVSNRLPLAGVLPSDRERIVALIDAALRGEVMLRPEHSRGL